MATAPTTRAMPFRAPTRAEARTDILLVVPPFQSCSRPALGVSQLKANLLRAGFDARVLYLNLRFAERIGWLAYEAISNTRYRELLGEFIFSGLLFERSEQDVQAYAERVLGNPSADYFLPYFHEGRPVVEKLQHLSREADAFCRTEALPEILAHDPWLVGFTSSFHQNCSSLALIRGIKQARPDVITAMGGANCEATMGEELLRRFPEIDHVGQGDCDHSFVELVRELRRGSDAPQVAGILSRGHAQRAPAAQLGSADLDDLPYPDIDDFFTRFEAMGAAEHIAPALVMETSRGCWWGAKQHCTFCGLNAESMAFRSKSAERVRAEVTALVQRYGTRYIAVVDNILDMKYFNTLLPALAEDPVAGLFFETKANLTRAQVELLHRANIKWIQPGIESLSDLTLQLMRKGSTKLQNIQLLKWCAEYRMEVVWNHLYGFPGESDEEMEQIAEEARSLQHLQPPVAVAVLRLDRYSPYYTERDKFGFEPLSVPEAYHHVYPFPDSSLEQAGG
jgi:magnesium-protoporphyrin IX monomethyl ester (oxidative) cyclase